MDLGRSLLLDTGRGSLERVKGKGKGKEDSIPRRRRVRPGIVHPIR